MYTLPPTAPVPAVSTSIDSLLVPSIEVPERLQADLMGHSISRPSYGDGGSLEQKAEWMRKIAIV